MQGSLGMTNSMDDSSPYAARTISRAEAVQRIISDFGVERRVPVATPWLLQRFLDAEIDLPTELFERFGFPPMFSVIKTRPLAEKLTHQVTTLSTQDDSGQIIIDIDPAANFASFTFAHGGLLSQCYTLNDPASIDRDRWLNLMERREAPFTFLWNATRWQHDYLIWVNTRPATFIYAFTPSGQSATARLTPEVSAKLFAWMRRVWRTPTP